MNREETKNAIAVMRAWADGTEIECRSHAHDGWSGIVAAKYCMWDFGRQDYRIKPKEPREFEIMVMGNGKILDLSEMSGGFLGEIIKVREVIE